MSRSVCLSSIATRSIDPIVPPACPIAVATRPSIPGRWSIRTRRTNENCADVGSGTGGADVRRPGRQAPESDVTRAKVFGTNGPRRCEHIRICSVHLIVTQPNQIGGATRGRPSRAAVYERLRVQIGELRERLGGLPSPLE